MKPKITLKDVIKHVIKPSLAIVIVGLWCLFAIYGWVSVFQYFGIILEDNMKFYMDGNIMWILVSIYGSELQRFMGMELTKGRL